MKTNIEEALDGLSGDELERLFEGIGEIGAKRRAADRIARRAAEKAGISDERKTSRAPRRAWLALAAFAAALACLGAGSYAYAEEAKEYKEATVYFEENGLSAEGLTRAEIKAVWRDITTESFTYDKTAEVIAHSMEINRVEGREILEGEPEPADISEAAALSYERYLKSTIYVCDYKDDLVEPGGILRHREGTINKQIGEAVIWTYKSDTMRFYFGQAVSDGVLGAGVVPDDAAWDSDSRGFRPAITKLTNGGELVWFVSWENGGIYEQISGVAENADGSFTVLSQIMDHPEGRFALCVSKISAEGEYLGSTVNPTGNVWVCDPIPFDGGYLAIQYEQEGDFTQSVVRIDEEGRLENEYSYSENGVEYKIAGMTVLNGKLYISAQLDDKNKINERIYSEVAFRELIETYGWVIPAEAFTPMAKDFYTAVLLVCGEDGGEPEVFWQVNGADAAGIKTENGRLVWTVKRIASAEMRLAFGMMPVTGSAEVWEYVFSTDGTLIECRGTGETDLFIK